VPSVVLFSPTAPLKFVLTVPLCSWNVVRLARAPLPLIWPPSSVTPATVSLLPSRLNVPSLGIFSRDVSAR